MDGVTVKVEEDYEQKPIPLPVGGEVYEIKVELEDDYIKEEEPLLPVAAVSGNDADRGDVKEEPHVTAVTGNNNHNKQDVKEENCVPIITSVSGNNDGRQPDVKEENQEPYITSVSGNGDEPDVKEENCVPIITSVSGNNDGRQPDVKEENQEPYITSVSGNGDEPDVKEENQEPYITSVSGNGDEQDVKEENCVPIITSVSGNNDGRQPDMMEETPAPNVPLETRTEQTGEKRKADEDSGPASKSLNPSDAAVAKEDEDSYDCEFCGEKFARRPRLGKHIMAKHLDELLVKCPECDMQFANKRALASHQMFHTGKKIFLCKSCGAAFKYVSNYVSHVNDHMGVQPYECGECGRGFSTKRRANLHVDACHSPFWPYKCSLCLAPFLEERKFLRHQEKKHGIVRERKFRRSYLDTY